MCTDLDDDNDFSDDGLLFCEQARLLHKVTDSEPIGKSLANDPDDGQSLSGLVDEEC